VSLYESEPTSNLHQQHECNFERRREQDDGMSRNEGLARRRAARPFTPAAGDRCGRPLRRILHRGLGLLSSVISWDAHAPSATLRSAARHRMCDRGAGRTVQAPGPCVGCHAKSAFSKRSRIHADRTCVDGCDRLSIHAPSCPAEPTRGHGGRVGYLRVAHYIPNSLGHSGPAGRGGGHGVVAIVYTRIVRSKSL